MLAQFIFELVAHRRLIAHFTVHLGLLFVATAGNYSRDGLWFEREL